MKTTLAYSAVGEEMSFGGLWSPTPFRIPPNPEDAPFMEIVIPIAEGLLADGKIKVYRPRVCEGGLRGILDGWQAMRKGKISGEKLVYRIADTI